MAESRKICNKTDDYVYDISLDGTVVNPLGLNIVSNTDGFNFSMPKSFRYTKEHPYISNGKGRNSVEGKAYEGVEADVAEFEDIYFNEAYNNGDLKMGLGVDEFCDACIQFARKNYADLMPDGSTKKVGNSIKSRAMSGYLESFLDRGIDMLLHGQGADFLNAYYDYISLIYNYEISIRDIASKGNIKKSLEDYKKDCQTYTKGGAKKSRQAWYELAIKEGLNVNVSDTVYYINVGTKKNQTDVKRVTHYYAKVEGEKSDVTKELEKEYKAVLKSWKEGGNKGDKPNRESVGKEKFGDSFHSEDEIILNCKIVPNEIIESEKNYMCSEVEGLEYNVEKYIEMFNKKVTPLLVCFSTEIRDKILVKTPEERKYFTQEEAKLVSGFPNKVTDQDTLEALMTPERKEITYWLAVGETPPFVKECEIDWETLVEKYKEEEESNNNEIYRIENEKYLKALEELTDEDVEALEEEGTLPSSISEIMTLGNDARLYFKKLPDKLPSTGGYVFDDISRTYLEKNGE